MQKYQNEHRGNGITYFQKTSMKPQPEPETNSPLYRMPADFMSHDRDYTQSGEALKSMPDYSMGKNSSRNQKEIPLATAYVRPQEYNGMQNLEKALDTGTLFSELHVPYRPKLR